MTRETRVREWRTRWTERGMEYGLCLCGCGDKTTIAKKDALCALRGEPFRFIRGHDKRLSSVEYTIDPATGCWTWQLFVDHNGYGRVKRQGRKYQAHRYFYELQFGPVPEGLQLDHLCRNRACVNPEHLEAVTCAENLRRGSGTKLSWEDVRAIRASSEPQRTLAARYGVAQATIWRALQHENWSEAA